MAIEVETAVMNALTAVKPALEASVRKWSSGTATTAQLRREDHPYARRHGRPRRNPALINVQSGVFLRGWQLEGPRLEQGAATLSAVNETPYARYLEHGTRTMFARPLVERVEAELKPLLEAALARELRG